MLGDASGYNMLESNVYWFVWIVYLIITIVLTIIALNLLISIIGDSYDKIIGIEENAKFYEKLTLIMNYEAQNKVLYDEYNQKSRRGFLYFVGEEGAFDSEALKEMRVNLDEGTRLRQKIDIIEMQMKKLFEEIKKNSLERNEFIELKNTIENDQNSKKGISDIKNQLNILCQKIELLKQ